MTDEPADDPPDSGPAPDAGPEPDAAPEPAAEATPEPAAEKVERWRLDADGRRHVVTLTQLSTFKRSIVWAIDGDEVASKETSEDSVTLGADDEPSVVSLKISGWSDSARRVRLFTGANSAAAHAAALTGLGGDDLHPDAGTKAARRQERMAAHPTRYTIQRTLMAIAGVGIPVLVIWLIGQLIGQIAFPEVDLPEIQLPDVDLPSIPLPSIDLPDVNLPDLPELPGWLKDALGYLKYVFPVAVAFVIARREVQRRAAAERERRATGERDRQAADERDRDDATEQERRTTVQPESTDADPVEQQRATTSDDA